MKQILRKCSKTLCLVKRFVSKKSKTTYYANKYGRMPEISVHAFPTITLIKPLEVYGEALNTSIFLFFSRSVS